MHSVFSLNKQIQQVFSQGNFEGVPLELYDPINYALSQGGKRLRPLLVLMTSELFGGDPEEAINPAIGVEIFHNFTLLHDDIMDKAPLRRGMETVYKRWNSNVAILSGDTMFVMAYEYVCRVSPDKLPFVLATFNDTARKVCEGQQYDMNFETLSDVSLKEYYEMIRLKTAVLIACCVKVGAIMANADPTDAERIYRFGENLGMAFQLQDDLLDTFGDTFKFGKEIGGDIVANKKTFLYLQAFERATPPLRKELLFLFNNSTIESALKIERIKAIYTLLKVDQLTRQVITNYFTAAIHFLDQVTVSAEAKKPLKKLSQEIILRES